MSTSPLKPSHKPIKLYYEALARFKEHGHTTEGNTRSAFADLLKRCCAPYDWHLVEEYPFKGTAKQALRADGALVDSLTVTHGFWEAKDSADDLQKEIKAKVARGYPLDNILFQSPDRAVLYQDSRIAFDDALTDPEKLIEVLELFFNHKLANIPDWEEAVFKFSEKIPDLAQGVTTILTDEHKKNADFREKFQAFADLCRQSINPDLTDPAIQKMLVQHLLTERIFRKVFNNQEFLSRNVVAAEIEKVIHSITAKHFSRDTFLKPLDRFYTAIEKAAEQQEGYTEKQHFLNAVYEKFFQSFDKKQADTHGIVYTPQPIVDFMVRSVEEILKSEFGKSLSDEGVHILDPFTGTGNFITRIMQQIKTSRLPQKYANELHCNEVMLLPYYIASMNIEHAYMEKVGQYVPFEGICLVDSFVTVGQTSFFTSANTARIKKQTTSPIRVIIGNPFYNMGQESENEQNKNRRYKAPGQVDAKVAKTYARDSKASLKNKLSDPYVKAFRWASDLLKKDGILCFISNSSYLDQVAFDGMRKNLAKDFCKIYIVDTGGNVRHNPKLSGSMHNVFGIQVGVSIFIGIRSKPDNEGVPSVIKYVSMPQNWTNTQKLNQFSVWEKVFNAPLDQLRPDTKSNWLHGQETNFDTMIPLGDKSDRGTEASLAIFRMFSLGLATNRDAWMYSFDKFSVNQNVQKLIFNYMKEAAAFAAHRAIGIVYKPSQDETELKWTDRLDSALRANKSLKHKPERIRVSLYRPFSPRHMYFDELLNHRQYQQPFIFSTPSTENVAFAASGIGAERPFATLATKVIPDLNFFGPGTVPNWFPFYSYDRDGTNRRENITDWALDLYRTHYADQKITKWDIFHSTYALLHHPEYRTRYAANLKRELPRIPFPPDFHAFAAAGKRLMELHIDYEKQPEYPLEEIEHPGKPWTLRVEKMSLSKDKTDLRYNEALTLRGIPPVAFDYRLGNRSALEWVIDQYRVSTDKRSGIVNDPNREDDPTYILRLIKQVIAVSLETQKIIQALPSLNLGSEHPIHRPTT